MWALRAGKPRTSPVLPEMAEMAKMAEMAILFCIHCLSRINRHTNTQFFSFCPKWPKWPKWPNWSEMVPKWSKSGQKVVKSVIFDTLFDVSLKMTLFPYDFYTGLNFLEKPKRVYFHDFYDLAVRKYT